MKPNREGTGAERIAFERQRQMDIKRWSESHDDAHMDHSLALAACAYATPAQLFRRREHADSVSFLDCWPMCWDSRYDKRVRDPISHRLLLAGEMPVPVRIRQLEKAGALIAAEIDRLLRIQAKATK